MQREVAPPGGLLCVRERGTRRLSAPREHAKAPCSRVSLASTRVRDEDEDRQCSLAGRALCVYISARPMCGRRCRVVPREGRSQPNSGTKPELSRHGGHDWRQGVAQIAGCPPSVTPRGRFWHRSRAVPRKSAAHAIARGRRRGRRGRELGFLTSSISHLGIASDYQSNFAGQLGIRAGSAGETLGRPVKAASPDFKMNRGLAARP